MSFHQQIKVEQIPLPLTNNNRNNSNNNNNNNNNNKTLHTPNLADGTVKKG